MNDPVHIVAQFSGIGGTEMHASTLAGMLGPLRPTVLWSDEATPLAARFGANNMQPFSGRMPRGGTLVILGVHTRLGIWLDHVRPRRLILVYNLSLPRELFAMLARLDRPTLPPVELVFVSERLRASVGLPGRICPPLVDIERFRPGAPATGRATTIGRHSRDTPDKHHPDDPALYRMLAWQGAGIRLMGASSLAPALADYPEIEILPAGSRPPEEFLSGLDLFFYRTAPHFHEPSGRVVMEAMACGLPVVADERGGYTDWISPGENGFIVQSQEGAFERLRQLLKDAAARRDMGRAARESAEKIAGRTARQAYLEWIAA